MDVIVTIIGVGKIVEENTLKRTKETVIDYHVEV